METTKQIKIDGGTVIAAEPVIKELVFDATVPTIEFKEGYAYKVDNVTYIVNLKDKTIVSLHTNAFKYLTEENIATLLAGKVIKGEQGVEGSPFRILKYGGFDNKLEWKNKIVIHAWFFNKYKLLLRH
jgi:hypothetical protein